jgi:acid phosphatase type 7
MQIDRTKRSFTFSIKLFIITALFIAGTVTAHTGRYRVVWTGDPSTTATIAWDQIKGDNPVVYYGTKDVDGDWKKYDYSAKPSRNVPNYRGMNTMFARLENLKADSEYYFIIKDSDKTGDQFYFRTAPDEPKAFTFIVGGDTKSSGSSLLAGRQSNMIAAKLQPLFVIFNGDFTSGDGTSPDGWQRWLDDWFILTTTEDDRLIPVVPVHGNHEDGEKSVLHNLFDLPYHRENTENIYFDVAFGDFFAFLALNSQIETGGSQLEWLEKNLKKYQNHTFTMAGYHKPFFPHTSGKRENNRLYDQWAHLFFTYGLDLSFDADSHMSKTTFPLRPSDESGSKMGFIRDDENGTMFLGEGSWGAGPRANDDDKPWTLRSGTFNQLKWLQVFPSEDGNPAHIDIRTVITAEKGKDGRLIPYSHDVVPLSNDDIFSLPEGIKLFSTAPYGDVIRYPFSE